MKSKILKGNQKIEVKNSFMKIDQSMINFCSFLSLNNIDIWMFPDELDDYLSYKNKTNKKDYIDFRSFDSFNHELKIKVNEFIYLVLYINLNLDRNNHGKLYWKYKYTEIMITDKNGIIIEEIS